MTFFLILIQPFLLFYAGANISNRWPKSLYFLSCTVYTIGQLFTIMHWPFGRGSVVLSITICFLVYGLHFVKDFNSTQSKRSIQDYLLLVWLFFLTILSFSFYEHDYNYYIHDLASVLLWINVIYALYLHFKGSTSQLI